MKNEKNKKTKVKTKSEWKRNIECFGRHKNDIDHRLRYIRTTYIVHPTAMKRKRKIRAGRRCGTPHTDGMLVEVSK